MILKQFLKLYTRSAEAGEGRIKNMIYFFIKATNRGKGSGTPLVRLYKDNA